MNVNVYDTYVRTVEGDLLHFDILLPAGEGFMAIHFANKWLHSIGKIPKELNHENCRLRHTVTTTPEIQKLIRVQGYFIIQMEGCPVLAN